MGAKINWKIVLAVENSFELSPILLIGIHLVLQCDLAIIPVAFSLLGRGVSKGVTDFVSRLPEIEQDQFRLALNALEKTQAGGAQAELASQGKNHRAALASRFTF